MTSSNSNKFTDKDSDVQSAFIMKLLMSNKAVLVSAIQYLKKAPSSLHRKAPSTKLSTSPTSRTLYHNCGSSQCEHNVDLNLGDEFSDDELTDQSSAEYQGKPLSELWDSGYSSEEAESIIAYVHKHCTNVRLESLDNCSINATAGSSTFQARIDEDGWMPAEDYERLQIEDPNHPLPRIPKRHLQGVFRKIQDENTPIDCNDLYEQQCKKIHQMHKMLGLPPPSFVPKFRE